jgi:hypothetical protein
MTHADDVCQARHFKLALALIGIFIGIMGASSGAIMYASSSQAQAAAKAAISAAETVAVEVRRVEVDKEKIHGTLFAKDNDLDQRLRLTEKTQGAVLERLDENKASLAEIKETLKEMGKRIP